MNSISKNVLTILLLSTALTATIPNAESETYMLEGKVITQSEADAAGLIKESMKDLDAGKISEAVSKAEAAKAKAPNFYYTSAAVGVVFARAGRSDEAIASFREALRLKPDLPDSLWSLAATLQSAGRTDEALATFQEFLKRFPNDAKASQATGFIALIESEKGKTPTNVTHSANDYFDEAIGSNPMRWSSSDMPIKIFIASGDGIQGYKPTYAEQLSDAISAWEVASQGKIKFERVDSPEKARITFKWSDNPKDVSNPTEGGEASLKPIGNSLAAAKIVVLTVKIKTGLTLNDQLIRLICTHELGHALGIAGHSPSPKDIMYNSLPLDYEHAKVSERDGKTLRRLYDIDVASIPHSSLNSQGMLSGSDIANSSALVDITQHANAAMNAKDYDKAVSILEEGLKKYPTSASLKHNLAAALNNTGLNAMNAQEFTKALTILQHALELNPESKPAKNNIAIIHYNVGLLAVKQAHFAQAEPDLKLAIQQCEANGNQTILQKAASEYVFVLKQLGKTDQANAIQAKYKVNQ